MDSGLFFSFIPGERKVPATNVHLGMSINIFVERMCLFLLLYTSVFFDPEYTHYKTIEEELISLRAFVMVVCELHSKIHVQLLI
jgi:hypothetical protein